MGNDGLTIARGQMSPLSYDASEAFSCAKPQTPAFRLI